LLEKEYLQMTTVKLSGRFTWAQYGSLATIHGLNSTSDEYHWQDDALCAQVDAELFFPGKGESSREAKRVCLGCGVKDECLAFALDNDERFGVWGGASERERRKMKPLKPGPKRIY
jgi:WhiB family redox-sensing transcriptional regulator